jgi:hypothetical protein
LTGFELYVLAKDFRFAFHTNESASDLPKVNS